jgi:gastric triacylglycerol lipase
MQNLVSFDGDLPMPPDFYLSFEQMVTKYGFDVDSYSVTTPDNYVLGNFRIRTKGLAAGAPAVFLQHGLFSCSDTWIVNNEKVAPAYQLARAGYDVYLGNNRGNFYSNKNTQLNPVTDDKEFHNYSFDKYGKYDLTS